MIRKAALIQLSRGSGHPQPRLAGLPLLVRILLIAQRAGLQEIVLVGGADPTQRLARDRRIRIRWRWIGLDGPEERSELACLRRLREEIQEDFVLFFADSIFDAAALQALLTLSIQGQALRMAVAGDGENAPHDASLFLCSRSFLDDSLSPQGGDTVASRFSRLRQQNRADTASIAGRLWTRTTDRKQLRGIERSLAHFHLKPTDGVFARFNKLVIAEPLIRLFLRTPATPNFITGLGLLFGLGSGVAFAQGTYWWSLAGAMLSYISAIMDHCDGMVARLKMMDSRFGTWFESAVDYASYFAAFSGLSIGLYRETGVVHHLAVGGLFIFGAITSFIVMSIQRKQTSGDNPADYANRVHRRMEANKSNFFHWVSLNLSGLVRRAQLPYYILALCLLNQRGLLLGFVALGANMVWLMTLYNNRLLRAPKAAAETD